MLLMAQTERFRIIVAEKLSPPAMDRLRSCGEVVTLTAYDEPALQKAVAEADALVVRTYARVTEAVIAAARTAGRLKVIARAGVGVDNIDLKAAAVAGIPVVHTPAACTEAVADLTCGLIIALQRHILTLDAGVRRGEFASLRADAGLTPELQHQTLGVIGMGRIGQAVSRRLNLGFGMRIIYYDIREIGYLPFVARAMDSAAAVYAEADVVTCHVPLTKLTRGMIDGRALAGFKAGSYLVNTSRGPVVNGAALAESLKAGLLSGAAIDVFDPEPPPPDHPLRSAPNCILTPHVGARSREGLSAMNDVVEDVIAVLEGKTPAWQADPEAY